MTNPETKTDLTSLLYKVMGREGESQRYVPKIKSIIALKESIERGKEKVLVTSSSNSI